MPKFLLRIVALLLVPLLIDPTSISAALSQQQSFAGQKILLERQGRFTEQALAGHFISERLPQYLSVRRLKHFLVSALEVFVVPQGTGKGISLRRRAYQRGGSNIGNSESIEERARELQKILKMPEGPEVEEALYRFASRPLQDAKVMDVASWQELLERIHVGMPDDQFIPPTILVDENNQPIGLVKDGDTVLIWNFRTDRAKPMMAAFLDIPSGDQIGGIISPAKRPKVKVVMMTEFDSNFADHAGLLMIAPPVQDTLCEVQGRAGISQAVYGETEKRRAIQWFSNGRKDIGEKDVSYEKIAFANSDGSTSEAMVRTLEQSDLHKKTYVVDSRKVGTHAEAPQMRAKEITDLMMKGIESGTESIYCNYANADMTAHASVTPDLFDRVAQGVLEVNEQLERLIPFAKANGYTILITADHGSAEKMLVKDGEKIKANPGHTDSLVPLIIAGLKEGEHVKMKPDLTLANVAPTILQLRGMTAPNSWDRGSAIEGTVQPDEHRKILEISLDGYGLSKEAFGNAMVRAAEMKGSPLIMDRLMQGEGGALFSPIEASGEKCGYGKGVPGTTEFGHLLMQAGRYIDSDKVIIDRLIKSGEFEKLPTLVDALDRAKKGQGKLHLMGMITTKVVHASMEHVEEILRVAAARGLHGDQIYIHPWTDGRDEADNGIASFNQLEEMIRKYNVGVIVGTQGRGWGMDRDNRWDRITPAFRSMVEAFAAYFVRVKSSLERRAHYQREIPLSRHDALEDIVHWDEVNYSKLTKPVLTAVNIDSIVGGQLKNGDDSKIREAITEYGESDIPRVFVSHNGRPKREAVGTLSAKEMAKFSLGPAKMVIEKILAERGLTKTIKTTDGLSDPEVADMIKHLKPGEWLILGNYRFDPRASSNSPSERKMLARDIVFQGGQEPVFSMFENNDFASTHRTEKEGDPSTRLVDFTEFLPSVAGPHLLREVTQAEVIRNVNKHPYILSLGGVKVADKANIARNGISKMEQGDMVVLKGKLAYPFLAVQHEFGLPKMQLGSSGVFKDETEKNAAREIFRLAKVKGVKIILPVDHVIAHVADIKELTKETEVRTVGVGEAIPEGWIGLDIGPESVRVMGKAYRTARFIFENGAAGYFEDKRFENTFALYQLFPAAKKAGAIIYGGGGDTKSAIAKSKIPEDTFEYVSTSGGALMDYLGMPDGQDSPPIAALKAVAVQTRAALPLKESGQQALEAQQQYTSPPATPAADEGGHGDLPSIFGPSRPAALAAPFWEWLIAVPLLGSTIDAFLLLRRASHEGRQPTRAEWTNRLLSLASGIFWWYTGFFAQGSGFFFATFLWVIASASMFSNVHVGKTDKQYGDLFLQGVGLHLILFLPLLFASYFPGGLVHAIGSTQVLFIGIPIYLALHLAIVIARSTAWLPKHWALPPMLHPDDQQIGFRLTIDLRAA